MKTTRNQLDGSTLDSKDKLDDTSHQEVLNNVETDGWPRVFKGPTNTRQEAVIGAFQHAWSCYKKYAWGHDNLKPLSMGSHDWFGLGLTIVDSLDTLYIMDLQEGNSSINILKGKQLN